MSVSVILYCSQDSSVGTVTWLPGRSGNRGSIPGRGKSFFSFPQQSEREVDPPLPDARVKNLRSRTFLWHAQRKIYVCRSKIRSVLVLRPLMCLGY
jgi:hypothetical protein